MKSATFRKPPVWERKTLDGIIGYFLEENCPQLGGRLMIQPVGAKIIELFDRYCPPVDRLKMGQLVWCAVDVNETAGYGKSIDQCKLNAVVLDLIHADDVEALLQGASKRERQKKVVSRLYEQAYEQGGVLTCSDVAAIMRKETGKLLPRRGSIHDMGPTLTHKRIICIIMPQGGENRRSHRARNQSFA